MDTEPLSAEDTETAAVKADQHRTCLLILEGGDQIGQKLEFDDGIILERQNTHRNMWALVVDDELVTYFDSDWTKSTLAMQRKIEKMAETVRGDGEPTPVSRSIH